MLAASTFIKKIWRYLNQPMSQADIDANVPNAPIED